MVGWGGSVPTGDACGETNGVPSAPFQAPALHDPESRRLMFWAAAESSFRLRPESETFSTWVTEVGVLLLILAWFFFSLYLACRYVVHDASRAHRRELVEEPVGPVEERI
jgi:hypothetical protein